MFLPQIDIAFQSIKVHFLAPVKFFFSFNGKYITLAGHFCVMTSKENVPVETVS